MNEYKKVRLGDVFDLQMGKTPDRNNSQYWNTTDNKWISIADISKSEKFIYETKEFISESAVKESGIKIIPKDTVIMSFKLSIGKTAITTEDCYSNEAIMAFHKKDFYEIDNNYLFHIFSNKDWSEGANKAVKGVTLNKASLSVATIPLPPIETQKQIAATLDKVTKIIVESRKLLEKYDLLIKSRFIEMFGTENDFSKWNCCYVEDVADVTVGVVIKPTQYYCEKGIPAFRSLNIGEMKVNDSDWVYFTEEGNEKNRKSILKENDVLVVRSGVPGKSCVITKKYEGYNVVDAIIAHPNLEKVNPVFLCMFTNMPHGMNQIKAKTGGAAQRHFNVGGYDSLKIILPPLSLQNNFAAFVQQIDKAKFENTTQEIAA